MTYKVHELAREGRVLVGPHAVGSVGEIGLGAEDVEEALRTGVVLARRRRDEAGTAVDGYKHFLRAVLAGGLILEVVFKFVYSVEQEWEEIVVVLTAYRGRA